MIILNGDFSQVFLHRMCGVYCPPETQLRTEEECSVFILAGPIYVTRTTPAPTRWATPWRGGTWSDYPEGCPCTPRCGRAHSCESCPLMWREAPLGLGVEGWGIKDLKLGGYGVCIDSGPGNFRGLGNRIWALRFTEYC